jgi:hypothetical protein
LLGWTAAGMDRRSEHAVAKEDFFPHSRGEPGTRGTRNILPFIRAVEAYAASRCPFSICCPVSFATSSNSAIFIVTTVLVDAAIGYAQTNAESDQFTCNWSDDMLPWSNIGDPDRGGKWQSCNAMST